MCGSGPVQSRGKGKSLMTWLKVETPTHVFARKEGRLAFGIEQLTEKTWLLALALATQLVLVSHL